LSIYYGTDPLVKERWRREAGGGEIDKTTRKKSEGGEFGVALRPVIRGGGGSKGGGTKEKERNGGGGV